MRQIHTNPLLKKKVGKEERSHFHHLKSNCIASTPQKGHTKFGNNLIYNQEATTLNSNLDIMKNYNYSNKLLEIKKGRL